MMMEEEEETLFDQDNLLGRSENLTNDKQEQKRKLAKTSALSAAFFCLGLCIAIPGPTLLDLGKMVGEDTHHMVLVFTARSLGYLLGSVGGGILGDLWDQQMLLALILGITAVATAGIPWCTALSSMAVLISVHGVAIGVLDSGGNVFCIRIWGKQSPSYMQLLHFAFGVGAFLAPLVAWPFLSNTSSLIGINDSVGLPYTFEVQAFHSLPGTISGKLKDSDGVTDATERSKRDLSGLMISLGYVKSLQESPPASRISSNIAWIKHRSRREDPGNEDKSVFNVSTTGLVNGTRNLGESDLRGNHSLTNETSADIPVTTEATPAPLPLPKKPRITDGESLSPKHADGEPNNAKLADIIRNPQKDLPPNLAGLETVAPPTTTVAPEQDDSSIHNDTLIKVNGSAALEKNGYNSTTDDEDDSRLLSTTLVRLNSTAATAVSATTTTTSTETPTTTTTAKSTFSSQPTLKVSTTTSHNADTSLHGNQPESPHTPSSSAGVETQTEETFKSISTSQPNTTSNSTLQPRDTLQFFIETVRNMSKIQFAYLVIGLLLAANSTIFCVLYMQDRAAHRSGPISTPLSHEEMTRPPKSACFIFIFLGLLFLFFFTYVGMEVTYGGLLPTFAMGFPGVIDTPAGGATLVALFWGSLAFGRGMAIFVARWFKPPCMMVVDLSLTLAGALVLVAGINASPKLLWVGTVTLGLGMSSLFPTAMSWTDFYYPLSSRAAAVFVAGCGIGEMIVPALTGQLYHSVDHMALMYVVLASSCFLVLLFSVLQILACQSVRGHQGKIGNGSPSRSHSGFMRLESSEDMADAVDMDLMEETVLGAEVTVLDIQEGSVEDLRLATTRKRGRGGRGRGSHQENGGLVYQEDNDTSESTKLVELSD